MQLENTMKQPNFHRDANGEPLHSGDSVFFVRSYTRSLGKGVVKNLGPKKISVWYGSHDDAYDVVWPEQIVKFNHGKAHHELGT